MILAKVVGDTTSTIKHEFYSNKKLMVLEKLTFNAQPTGEQMVAIDSVSSGVGDMVIVLDEGTGARQIVKSTDAPLRSIIVGIVDQLNTP